LDYSYPPGTYTKYLNALNISIVIADLAWIDTFNAAGKNANPYITHFHIELEHKIDSESSVIDNIQPSFVMNAAI
jgi:hypothetical protein